MGGHPGVLETADQAVHAAQSILQLFDEDRRRIESLGRAAGSALRVHDILRAKPIISISSIAKLLQLSDPTIYQSVKHLEKTGIVHEVTGKERNRLFVYSRYMRILDEGTKPIGLGL